MLMFYLLMLISRTSRRILTGSLDMKPLSLMQKANNVCSILSDSANCSTDETLDWSVEGRGGLNSWKNLGYIPTDDFDPYGGGPSNTHITTSASP